MSNEVVVSMPVILDRKTRNRIISSLQNTLPRVAERKLTVKESEVPTAQGCLITMDFDGMDPFVAGIVMMRAKEVVRKIAARFLHRQRVTVNMKGSLTLSSLD